jgi:hypothetical protein
VPPQSKAVRTPRRTLGTRFRLIRNAVNAASGTGRPSLAFLAVEPNPHQLLALDLLRTELGDFADLQRDCDPLFVARLALSVELAKRATRPISSSCNGLSGRPNTGGDS